MDAGTLSLFPLVWSGASCNFWEGSSFRHLTLLLLLLLLLFTVVILNIIILRHRLRIFKLHAHRGSGDFEVHRGGTEIGGPPRGNFLKIKYIRLLSDVNIQTVTFVMEHSD
jgi:hypothetical protein